MLRKQSTILSGTFLLLLSLLSFGCGDSSSSGGTLTGIDIAPISPSIAVGGTVQFTATGHFSNGPDQNITAESNWSSSSTGTATIQQLGTSPGWRRELRPERPPSPLRSRKGPVLSRAALTSP